MQLAAKAKLKQSKKHIKDSPSLEFLYFNILRNTLGHSANAVRKELFTAIDIVKKNIK